MLTEKDYCDYETSRELKELGFVAGLGEGDCGYCLYDDAWHDQVNRPLLYEVQKWLREEKNIEVNATYDNVVELHWHWYMKSLTNRNQDTSIINHDSYEQALLAGIKEAVKILKEENND